jgi:hypothetical protein
VYALASINTAAAAAAWVEKRGSRIPAAGPRCHHDKARGLLQPRSESTPPSLPYATTLPLITRPSSAAAVCCICHSMPCATGQQKQHRPKKRRCVLCCAVCCGQCGLVLTASCRRWSAHWRGTGSCGHACGAASGPCGQWGLPCVCGSRMCGGAPCGATCGAACNV